MNANLQKLLVSKREAAQALGICVRSLEYLIGNKELPTRRVGRRVLIPAPALEQFARRDYPTPLLPAKEPSTKESKIQ
jgi:excisionase family DNA binding protein